MNRIQKSPNQLRIEIAEMIANGGEGHIPSSFSIVDILYSLYNSIPNLGDSGCAKKFVLSKGHGSAALYIVLAACNLIPDSYISHYGKSGSKLGGHPERKKVPAIEASTGSLGHGFPFAVGLALSSRIKLELGGVICLVGDGECQEGTIWEAASIASNQKLGNVLAIVDWNGSAAQLQPIENMKQKWQAFGWHAEVVDGHDTELMDSIFENLDFEGDVPRVVIAKTTKGKGVNFLEGHGIWHHKMPGKEEFALIMKELSSEP